MIQDIMTNEEALVALNAMSIADLRICGREAGIASPTTYNREPLIEKIMRIKTGELSTEQKSKKGRPTKSQLNTMLEATILRIITPHPASAVQQKAAQFEGIPDIGTENIVHEHCAPNDLDKIGVLEVMPDGYGFLRVDGFNAGQGDVYVPAQQVKRFGLKTGDKLECRARMFENRNAPSVIYIFKINDIPCDKLNRGRKFEDLVSCYPNQKITLEREKNNYPLRLIDLIAPIGKGQRGIIVSPPKAGKTMLLKSIAQAVRKNHPEIYLCVLLIDERPEEVTDFQHSVDCDVIASTFDQSALQQTVIADLVIRNAKRRVEQGQDVMILLDSITRFARAHNQIADPTGRTLTGGLDIAGLAEPKKFFGAGRNVEGDGSLTIIATALIETGSRMDDIIYEEFKGTGNMEIHLDRRMSEKRIFPAIDLAKSGTRREEMLLTQNQLEGMWLIRRALANADTVAATEKLLDLLMSTNNNEEFINLLKHISKKQKGQ